MQARRRDGCVIDGRRENERIDLDTWSTPNGRKLSILLEELALAYRGHPVDIGRGEEGSALRECYLGETSRLDGVLDARLKDHECLADEYSIADIASCPRIARYEWHPTDLDDFLHLRRWFGAISAQPAVPRGMKSYPSDAAIR